MKNKRARHHAGSNRRGRSGVFSSPGGVVGAGWKHRGGGGGGRNGERHSGGRGRQCFDASSPLSAGGKRHKVARQGGGVRGWAAGESTYKRAHASKNNTSFKNGDALQSNRSGLGAAGGDFGGDGGAIHHVNSIRQRQQRRHSDSDLHAGPQASANADNDARAAAGLSAQKPNRNAAAHDAAGNGLAFGARESLASAFNAAQQPRRRRIDFHSPRRPPAGGASPIATPLVRSAAGGANKSADSSQAEAGEAGGRDREGHKESGLERCNRLAEKAIGLPHAEKVRAGLLRMGKTCTVLE